MHCKSSAALGKHQYLYWRVTKYFFQLGLTDSMAFQQIFQENVQYFSLFACTQKTAAMRKVTLLNLQARLLE